MRCLLVLSLVSTVFSSFPLNARHNSSKARRMEKRAIEALNFDAAAVFPPTQLGKRGVGDLLGDVVSVATPVVNGLLPPPTTAAPPPTTAAPTASNAPTANPAPTTAAPNAPSPSNPPANPGASPTPSAAPGNSNPSNGNASAGGSGIDPKDGSGVPGGTNAPMVPTPQVVTDRFGSSWTITGPVTRTWVTTLPNGVVSTVTEVLTPTVEVNGAASSPPSSSAGKIGAIVGTIVTVFIITFAVALAFLMMRKRQKRRNALLESRPTSIASFGSVSDEFNQRRIAAGAPNVSQASIPAFVDGTTMDFPLPPVPSANSRPLSGVSDASFDFSQYRKSRTSIIEDRNRFRKIGEYPEAESYTPFVLPPSEFGHSTEAAGTPRASVIVDQDSSSGRSSSGGYATGNNPDLLMTSENPFTNPVTVPQAAHKHAFPPNPLTNIAARQSTLWRTSTFGPGSKSPAARRMSQVPSRNTVISITSTEYGTALDHGNMADDADSNGAPSRHQSTSTEHFSYHSAFEAYARSISPQAPANPFADQPLPTIPQHKTPPRVLYPALRPGTATSSGGTSMVSSVANANRDLGGTPDPKDLFYRNSENSAERYQLLNERISEESRSPSDDASTVRAPVTSPVLHNATTQGACS